MTIDERIEALTQSVDLIATLHVDLERQTAAHFAETFQLINQLARVVQSHEHRLNDIEHPQ